MTAQQGHKYAYCGLPVLAMESGDTVLVREIVSGDVWQQLGNPERVHCSQLKPLPMVYFGGQVPQ